MLGILSILFDSNHVASYYIFMLRLISRNFTISSGTKEKVDDKRLENTLLTVKKKDFLKN